MVKSVLVTGVGSGIGKEVCLNFLDKGWAVFGVLRNAEQSKRLNKEGKKLKGELTLINVDLDEIDFTTRIIDILSDLKIKSIDVLINVAGRLDIKELVDIDSKHIEEVMKTNFLAPVLLTKAMIPYLSKSNHGNVVNITSMSGYQGSVRFSGLSVYGASKAALSSWTESIAVELASVNVHANALAIGSVNTNMLQKAFPDYQATINPEEMAEYIHGFADLGYKFYNGKTLSVAITNP